MREVICMSVVCLLLSNSDANGQMKQYRFLKKIRYVDKLTRSVDSSMQYFTVISNNQKLFFHDMKGNLIMTNKITYKVDNSGSMLFIDGFNSTQVFDLRKDSSVTVLPNIGKIPVFYNGISKYSGVDSVINGIECRKFTRVHKGNPGIDIPSYTGTEYIEKTSWLPVFSIFTYSYPWREVEISLLK